MPRRVRRRERILIEPFRRLCRPLCGKAVPFRGLPPLLLLAAVPPRSEQRTSPRSGRMTIARPFKAGERRPPCHVASATTESREDGSDKAALITVLHTRAHTHFDDTTRSVAANA